MPWLLAEDAALKNKLQGLKVTDINAPAGGRPVAVRFRLPETELADMTYPTVVIDHAGISKDDEREHRGYIQIPYAPEGYANWAAADTPNSFDPTKSPYYGNFPIPMNIDYTVTLYSRKQMHNQSLIGSLTATSRLHPRYAYLAIPEDGTVRRLELMGGPETVTENDPDGKRIFRTLYSVRVSSELVPEQIDTVTKVLTTVLTLNYTTGTYG